MRVPRPVAVAVLAAALAAAAGCTAAPLGDRPAPTPPADVPAAPVDLADPEQDVLGWEDGYWYNESLPVTSGDGLNESERDAVVARAMARVEHLRHLEFRQPVDVSVVSRAEYRQQYAGSGEVGDALRTFDDAKFEALFLVGEDRDAVAVQRSNRGSNVLGFYSPGEDRIVVVAPSATPTIDETTLGHELVHALQFRNFDANIPAPTRDAANARNGLIEGEARFVDQQYGERCGAAWRCVTPEAGGGGGGDLHIGVYVMQYFPYSDGPGFVRQFHEEGGWAAVGDLYRRPPETSEQVAQPEKYGEDAPTDPALPDRSTAAWDRVTVDGRAPYGEVGVGGLTAMFAYPAYDDRADHSVLAPRAFLNYRDGAVASTDPFNYTTPPVEGWDGERLWVYERDDGALGYAWRIAWDSPRDARQFADTYRDLLRYWGGQRLEAGLWLIPEGESPFADAFRLTVTGDTVTIVNAPTVDALDDVHSGS